MNVYFAYTSENLLNNKKICEKVRKIILDNGNILTRDWLEEGIEYLTVRNTSEESKSKFAGKGILKKVVNAIDKADSFIAEGSFGEFSLVYQLSLALRLGKNVLFLVRNDFYNPETKIAQEFAYEVNVPNFYFEKYKTENELEILIKHFLKQNKGKKLKYKRFNFVINQEMDSYLNWLSFKGKKTKAEIVRYMIEEKMKANRSDIKKDLSGIEFPTGFKS